MRCPVLHHHRHHHLRCRCRRSLALTAGQSPLTFCSPLRERRAGVRYRSLPPDDPFGERSSWEDPSDGVYAAWKDVDQEGFVAAAESDAVRAAHFGPEWSRFTAVGLRAVAAMQADPRHQSRAEGEPSAYPSAEERHAMELRQRRKLMSHNYATYEEFLAGEAVDGDDRQDGQESPTGEELDHPQRPSRAPDSERTERRSGSSLYTEAQMERAFSEVEGLDGRDRMALRHFARERLMEAEAALEGEDDVELPAFMRNDGDPSSPTAAPSPTTNACRRREVQDGSVSAEGAPKAAPEAFKASVLARLPGQHGDPEIPLVDPLNWSTEQILRFLECFECRDGGAASSLDESMRDAFHLAKVDGEMLLNVVTPPTLFRIMRRWHTRRLEAIAEAWRQCGWQRQSGSTDTEAIKAMESAAISAAVGRIAAKLDEAVGSVTPLLIQETILLCFPYAR